MSASTRLFSILWIALFSIAVLSSGCDQSGGNKKKKAASEHTPQEVAKSTTKNPKAGPAKKKAAKARTAKKKQMKKDGDSQQLVAGGKAPDFEVELMGGKQLKFSEHLASSKGPTILLFNRAHW